MSDPKKHLSKICYNFLNVRFRISKECSIVVVDKALTLWRRATHYVIVNPLETGEFHTKNSSHLSMTHSLSM